MLRILNKRTPPLAHRFSKGSFKLGNSAKKPDGFRRGNSQSGVKLGGDLDSCQTDFCCQKTFSARREKPAASQSQRKEQIPFECFLLLCMCDFKLALQSYLKQRRRRQAVFSLYFDRRLNGAAQKIWRRGMYLFDH